MKKLDTEQQAFVRTAVAQTATRGTPTLLIVLVVLKAIGVLQWSWFWTIALPILLPFIALFGVIALVAVGFGLSLVGFLVVEFVRTKYRRYRLKKRRK